MSFTDFWEIYPRRVAKKNAEKAWNKLDPSPAIVSLIINDVRKRSQSEQWRQDGGKFIPHPATYLNGERWHDEEPSQQIGPTRRIGASTSYLDYDTTVEVDANK